MKFNSKINPNDEGWNWKIRFNYKKELKKQSQLGFAKLMTRIMRLW